MESSRHHLVPHVWLLSESCLRFELLFLNKLFFVIWALELEGTKVLTLRTRSQKLAFSVTSIPSKSDQESKRGGNFTASIAHGLAYFCHRTQTSAWDVFSASLALFSVRLPSGRRASSSFVSRLFAFCGIFLPPRLLRRYHAHTVAALTDIFSSGIGFLLCFGELPFFF